MGNDVEKVIEIINYLNSFFISENVSSVKAREIAKLIQNQQAEINRLKKELEDKKINFNSKTEVTFTPKAGSKVNVPSEVGPSDFERGFERGWSRAMKDRDRQAEVRIKVEDKLAETIAQVAEKERVKISPGDALRWVLNHCQVKLNVEGGAWLSEVCLMKLAMFLSNDPTAFLIEKYKSSVKAEGSSYRAPPVLTTELVNRIDTRKLGEALAFFGYCDTGTESIATNFPTKINSLVHSVLACKETLSIGKEDREKALPVATVIKKGSDRQWMSENLGRFSDGTYNLYLHGFKGTPNQLDFKGALIDLVAEFKRIFPIYYNNEPWAHDKNAIVQNSELLLRVAGK